MTACLGLMTDHEPARVLPGDLTPAKLAERLGWPVETVRDLIARGAIKKVESRWVVDAPRELRNRWAEALWCPGHDEDEGDIT